MLTHYLNEDVAPCVEATQENGVKGKNLNLGSRSQIIFNVAILPRVIGCDIAIVAILRRDGAIATLYMH